MKRINLKKIVTFFVYIGCFLLLTSSSCSDSGSNSGSGNSQEIQYDQTYEFKSVNLKYDLSQYNNWNNNIYSDMAELGNAHSLVGTELSGSIDNLVNILQHIDNYPKERQPEIKVTIKPTGENPVEHICNKNDIGNNYVTNLPNYGINVNTLIISVKSITTLEHQIQLCWSKSFDLNQQWWENYSDKYLHGAAEVKIGFYVKSNLSDDLLVMREVDGKHILYPVNGINSFEDGFIECDFEITNSSESDIITPTLEGPVYINGTTSSNIAWDKPTVVRL